MEVLNAIVPLPAPDVGTANAVISNSVFAVSTGTSFANASDANRIPIHVIRRGWKRYLKYGSSDKLKTGGKKPKL